MTAIRVLLGDMTPMFGSMINGLIGGIDEVEIIREPLDAGRRMASLTQSVDVLLVRSADIADCPAMLADIVAAAPVGVVAVDDDGDSGTSYRVLKKSVSFSGNGTADLLGALRIAAGRA